MKILEILFPKKKGETVKTRAAATQKIEQIVKGTDPKSEIVHDKANAVQKTYFQLRKEALTMQKSSTKMLEHLDSLSALAFGTGGIERGLKNE